MSAGNNRAAANEDKQTAGLSQASMESMISADSAMAQAKVQGRAVTGMEGRIRGLKAEIRQDAGSGSSVKKKQEELEKLEQKIQAGRRLKRKWESVKKFFRSKMFREALLHAKKEVLYFLKKAAPKKVTGTVRFGFDDPALTGETLGILGMIYGKLPKDLSIQPDFEQEILRGDVRMKGSFQAVTAAGIALRLFRDQNLRKTIRHFKHKEA